jgi:hypothetical protein
MGNNYNEINIQNNDIDASFINLGATDKNGWVRVEKETFSVHEIRVALATVHEYINDGTVHFCDVHIDYTGPTDIGVFVYSRDDMIYVSIGCTELARTTETFKIVTLTLSKFLSIATFVLDTLS